MVQFLLIVGILNVLLGFGLAVFLADRPPSGNAPPKDLTLPSPQIRPGLPAAPRNTAAIRESNDESVIRNEFPPAISDTEQLASPAAAFEELPVATIDELPESWRHVLDEERLTPGGFAEAVTQGLRVHLAAYRQQVLAAEERARLLRAQDSPEALEQLVANVRYLHHEWLGKAMQGAEMLHQRRGRLGAAGERAAQLETLLSNHAAQMEMLEGRIGDIDIRTDFALGCRRLLAELLRLTAAIHLLRDELTAALADILQRQQGLHELHAEQRLDPHTGCLNRLGLTALWDRPDDDFFARQAVLIALDGFGKINERLGTQAGDRTLKALSQLVAELLNSAHVPVQIARLSGTRFLLLLTGITLERATSLAEELRQSLEAVTLNCQGTCFGVSTRLGISAAEQGESMEKLLARLAEAIDAAEIAGGNRCAIADAIGTQVVAPQDVPVIGRRVTIGDDAELPHEIPGEVAACGTEPLQPPSTAAAAEPAEEVSTSSGSILVPQCTPDG